MTQKGQFTTTERRWILAVAAVIVWIAASRAAHGQTVEALTLEQAIALALEKSGSVQAAELQIERAERDLAAARTRRLPSFEVQLQANQLLAPIGMTFPEGAFGSYPGLGPIPDRETRVESSMQPSGRVSASVAQPLTGLKKANLGVKAGEITRAIEKEQWRAQRASVANDVRRRYYAVLQLQSAADAARDQVMALREMSQVVARYVAMETALAYEGIEVKAKLAAEEYRVVSLENAALTQKEQLNVLFGRDPRTPFEVALVSEAAAGDALDVQAARARALLRRPELQHARLQVELADTDRRSKKTEFIPQISVALSYDSFVNVDLLPRNIAQVGIQMKWEPFDWGRKQKELASKALAVEQARTQSRDQANRVLAEVERAHRQLQEARSLLAVRRLAHESAQERSRVTLLRAGQQAVLVKDVLSAQASLSDARAQLDEAQLSLWQARADLDKAMGEEN